VSIDPQHAIWSSDEMNREMDDDFLQKIYKCSRTGIRSFIPDEARVD